MTNQAQKQEQKQGDQTSQSSHQPEEKSDPKEGGSSKESKEEKDRKEEINKRIREILKEYDFKESDIPVTSEYWQLLNEARKK